MKHALQAVSLALQEQLCKGETPSKMRTLHLAWQYGARTSTRERIAEALDIINFDKLEELCSTPST